MHLACCVGSDTASSYECDPKMEGELRLIPTSNITAGLLNICHHKQWGTVCSEENDLRQESFSNISASVACYQMGFEGAQRWDELHDSDISQKVWLWQVDCTGNETKLVQCGGQWCSQGTPCSSCAKHFYDVGITCTGECCNDQSSSCQGQRNMGEGEGGKMQ